jgi:hypothetical protein
VAGLLGPAAVPVVFVLVLFLVGWYVAGNEVMRRRACSLALWCKRTLDPAGGTQSILWLTTSSFRFEVEDMRPPLEAVRMTGLVESWDVPMVWLWNRSRGRRDMVLVQLSLRRRPIAGLELYRPGAWLAGDSRRLAREEGWPERPFEEFALASPVEAGQVLARRLMVTLSDERPRLLRLAVRRQAPNLTLALNVPEGRRSDPTVFHVLLQRLAEAAGSPA